MNSIFIIKFVVNCLLYVIFALPIFLLTTLRVNSLFCRHINDIVNKFGVHCSHLIIIFLPFCSQFVSNIVTKLAHILAIFVGVFVAVLQRIFTRHRVRIWRTLLPFSCRFLTILQLVFCPILSPNWHTF